MSSALTIRSVRADDDLDAELDLRHRSFGPMDGDARAYWRAELAECVRTGRQYGAWEGGRMIGAARYHDMLQYWHGRPVRMAGVGGVKVAPEARGRGVGRALMTGLLTEIAGQGYPLSALYPATAQIYRTLGWELAGGNYLAEVPGRTLGSLVPPDPHVQADLAPPAGGRIRRAEPADAVEVIAVLGAVHAVAGDCGPVTRDAASVRRWLASPEVFAYLADDGFLGYGWHRGSSDEILVEALQAASAATVRALWGILASHASVTQMVYAAVGPSDPVSWLTREPDVSVRRQRHWMLRVLDPAAAIAGRGFPAGAAASAVLDVADHDLPANAGRYRLTVSDGTGAMIRLTTGRSASSPAAEPVALGPRGFAALYAGVPVATLRAAGLPAGGDQKTDRALDAVFAAQSFMLDYF